MIIDSEWGYRECAREYYKALKEWKEGDDEQELDERMAAIRGYLLAKSLVGGDSD